MIAMPTAPRTSLAFLLRVTCASALLAISNVPLQAVDCSVPSALVGSSSSGAHFTITHAGFTVSDIQTAISYWSGCVGYASEIPSFQIGGSGGVPVSIVKIVGLSQSPEGGCGEARYDLVNGRIESVSIKVWTKQADGSSCDPLSDSIAHELGHVLGLGNALQTECMGRIMGRRIRGLQRVVEYDDCAMADDMWETPQEAPPSSEDPYCNAYCWTSCSGSYCPPRPPDAEGCPVLLDLENDGVHLTGLGEPVWFDIDADGEVDLMSWTDRGEGMLVLDRNSNALVDDGGELFGNYTRLSDGSQALNGYLALAELDTWALGGNEDGRIDPGDAAFSQLRLWTDTNHNAISEPTELQTLEEARVTAIGLNHRRSNRTDQHGNELRFRGRAWRTGQNGTERPVQTWDVFFLVVP